jgi:hypothetical protein
MNSYVEIGLDGQRLEWRAHIFSALLRERDADHFALEPVVSPVDKNAGLGFRVTKEEIEWYWANWEQAEIQYYTLAGKGQHETRVSPQASRIDLTDLGETTEVELSLHGADGIIEAIRCAVPFGQPSRDITLSQQGTTVLIKAGSRIPTCTLYVAKVGRKGEDSFRRMESVAHFAGRPELSLSLADFKRGAIVVYTRRGSTAKLLNFVYVSDHELSKGRSTRQDWQNAERWLRNESASFAGASAPTSSWTRWLNNWTAYSRERLSQLHDHADRQFNLIADPVATHGVNYLVGLNRTLALQELGCDWARDANQIWRLQDGELSEALGRVFPVLRAILAQPVSPEEKLWAIKHVQHLQLLEAWADAGHGLPALNRSLHLAETRAAAVASWQARRHSAKTTTGGT